MLKAVIIYGPPSGGKGTQAKLVAQKFDLVNFDTGSYIRNEIYDPKNRKSKVIQKQKAFVEKGQLATPSWVLSLVKKHIKEIRSIGMGIVLSGSPRTVPEAIGDKKTEGIMHLLEREYGKRNIIIFELRIPLAESLKRNTTRIMCETCDTQLIGAYSKGLKKCPFCAGKLFKRADDRRPEVIKKRLEVYLKQTKPIIRELKRHGFKVTPIDGTLMPTEVFMRISKYIKREQAY